MFDLPDRFYTSWNIDFHDNRGDIGYYFEAVRPDQAAATTDWKILFHFSFPRPAALSTPYETVPAYQVLAQMLIREMGTNYFDQYCGKVCRRDDPIPAREFLVEHMHAYGQYLTTRPGIPDQLDQSPSLSPLHVVSVFNQLSDMDKNSCINTVTSSHPFPSFE